MCRTAFLPDGALGVPHGGDVVPAIDRAATTFRVRSLPVFATRDWHPPDHVSFQVTEFTQLAV